MNDNQHPLERLARRQDPRGAEQILHAATKVAAHRRQRLRLTIVAAAVAATAGSLLLIVDDGEQPVRTTDPLSEATTTTAATTSTPVDTTSSTAPTSAGSTPAGVDLPGEPTDGWPREGIEVGVVGVSSDDTLNVRSIPGLEGDVIAELDPLATGIMPTGHSRRLSDGSLWSEVTVDDITGWVHSAYIGVIGRTLDVTDRLYPVGTPRPSAATVRDLATDIADTMAADEASYLDVTIVDSPTDSLRQFTIDVTGLRDDSGLGYRFRVFAETDGNQFTVGTVEETLLCRRGGGEGGCL